jgi:hypothetical protein
MAYSGRIGAVRPVSACRLNLGGESREGGPRYEVMQKKQAPEGEPKDKPARTDQARQVAEEYADDQREIIRKLRKPLN